MRFRKAQGYDTAAEALVRRIVSLDVDNLWAILELALLLYHKGRTREAEIQARNGVRIAPHSPQAHNLLGIILTDTSPQVGEYHFRRVLDLTGSRDPILLANLALCLKN